MALGFVRFVRLDSRRNGRDGLFELRKSVYLVCIQPSDWREKIMGGRGGNRGTLSTNSKPYKEEIRVYFQ